MHPSCTQVLGRWAVKPEAPHPSESRRVYHYCAVTVYDESDDGHEESYY